MNDEQKLPHKAVGQSLESKSSEDTLAYWTEERIKNAIPLKPPKQTIPKDFKLEELTGDNQPLGEPKVVHPGIPQNLDQTGTVVPNPGSWPYACIGKLLFTQNGTDYVGTAFSVSGSKSVFMTAGHCVYDQASGKWSENTVLSLGWSSSSQGQKFTAVNLVTCYGWIRNEGYQYDIGAGIVSGDMFTNRGNLGILFNQQANTGPWTAVGYPADPNPPYGGNTMYQSVGSYISPIDPGTIGMNNNDMGGGSSGGPWIVNSDWGYVNGLQSYDYDNPDTDEYSPYFGEAAYNIWYCAVTGGTC
ncbi:MAG: hypothetical protein ED557_03595 [Balneola sp.]|nr:MAG: hypothetical protein ED557_03595 [Balneola sp.]